MDGLVGDMKIIKNIIPQADQRRKGLLLELHPALESRATSTVGTRTRRRKPLAEGQDRAVRGGLGDTRDRIARAALGDPAQGMR
jgi:hypothetical protein